MGRFVAAPGLVAALVLLGPGIAYLGYETGRVAEYRRAAVVAENAGAALAGALEVCRLQGDGPAHRVARPEVGGLTPG